jgi:hypothetical protein
VISVALFPFLPLNFANDATCGEQAKADNLKNCKTQQAESLQQQFYIYRVFHIENQS